MRGRANGPALHRRQYDEDAPAVEARAEDGRRERRGVRAAGPVERLVTQHAPEVLEAEYVDRAERTGRAIQTCRLYDKKDNVLLTFERDPHRSFAVEAIGRFIRFSMPGRSWMQPQESFERMMCEPEHQA